MYLTTNCSSRPNATFNDLFFAAIESPVGLRGTALREAVEPPTFFVGTGAAHFEPRARLSPQQFPAQQYTAVYKIRSEKFREIWRKQGYWCLTLLNSQEIVERDLQRTTSQQPIGEHAPQVIVHLSEPSRRLCSPGGQPIGSAALDGAHYRWWRHAIYCVKGESFLPNVFVCFSCVSFS